ncbi:hypothetical protein F1643_07005, partial [Azospirillum sp. INR13]|nr:hypothetical protein [Azospirillum sp. INR13]
MMQDRPACRPWPPRSPLPWSPTRHDCGSASTGVAGATIVDGGIARPGGLEAGRRIAELCN